MKQTGEKSISELWETFKWLNMCVIFILKGNGTRKEAKKLKSNGHNFFFNLKISVNTKLHKLNKPQAQETCRKIYRAPQN